MKNKRLLRLFLIICLALSSAGCASQKSPEEPAEPDAETAMNNFLTKLEKGNYVVEAPGYAKTTVYSEEVVYFTADPGSLLNLAFVTLDNETFRGDLNGDTLSDVAFVAPGNAIEAVIDLLPNNWINAADGNIWNLFYNNVDNPLEFTSKDETEKTTLLGLAGYSQTALEVMGDVCMTLDKEDPAQVHFTAGIGDMGMFHYDDLDLTLQFGVAESDDRIDKWLSNPTYPSTRSSWDIYDCATLDSIFLKDYGEIAVPFPDFASYALIFDDNAYLQRNQVELYDAHASEQDVKDYIALLESKGYEKTTDDNGNEVYRLLLREEKQAYAELEVYYDNGFELIGRMHYTSPEYEGMRAINEVLQENGFVEFMETDAVDGWKGKNTAVARSESWLYYFNYDLYLELVLTYEDYDAVLEYLEEYGNRMESAGYKAAYAPDGASYENSNGFKIFRYTFYEEDNNVVLTFKNERSLTAEEANLLIKEHNLPEASFHGDIGGRDHTVYYHNISGFTGLHMIIYQPFDSVEEASAFLDSYTASMEELGYDYVNPQTVGSYRNFAYTNEELLKTVGFDLVDYGDHASVTLEFNSVEEEADTILEGALIH